MVTKFCHTGEKATCFNNGLRTGLRNGMISICYQMLAICDTNDMVKVQINTAPDLKVQILHTIFIQGEMDIILLILVE